MPDMLLSFLTHQAPYDALPPAVLAQVVARATWLDLPAGAEVYGLGDAMEGLYIVTEGLVSVRDSAGHEISRLSRGNSFGERGLMRDGRAVTAARTRDASRLILIPADLFHHLRARHAPFRKFFDRSGPTVQAVSDLASVRVDQLMARDPQTCGPDLTLQAAAQHMQAARISCLCVMQDGALTGIVTQRDLVGKALAPGLPHDTPIRAVMTPNPRSLPPTAIGSDVLHSMMEYGVGHLPVMSGGELIGIVTKTDLTRFEATNSAGLVAEAARAETVEALSEVTARIPALLAQLVAAGHRHDVVTRLITDIADVVTRRLLRLAEADLGPAPMRYCWLACGSQGRQEQTGVSDQDNCLMLEADPSEAERAYFTRLAHKVTDGLNACGYVYCPGDMMATNPRWLQPVGVWREYFDHWIQNPSKEAQMLASVMFDLRVIGGDADLFEGLHRETLAAASENSIFTAHMASNALSHPTPLSLLKGLVTIRSGEHRNTIDLKHNGVVPVVDLGRAYALQGQLEPVNTRARLEAAIGGVVSYSGGRDLLDAYDVVAQSRLAHQARQIRAGQAPDNFLPPAELSPFERSHLRDAFVVIKTMQSALMQGRGLLG